MPPLSLTIAARAMTTKLRNFAARLSGWLALIGAIGIFAMLIHVTTDVILRQFISRPIPATVEIVSRYYMIFIAFLPLGWSQLRGDMIVVEVFSGAYRGVVKKVKNLLVKLLITLCYGALAYTTYLSAMREFGVGSYVVSLGFVIPTWPSYFVLPISFGLATCVSLLQVFLEIVPETGPQESVR